MTRKLFFHSLIALFVPKRKEEKPDDWSEEKYKKSLKFIAGKYDPFRIHAKNVHQNSQYWNDNGVRFAQYMRNESYKYKTEMPLSGSGFSTGTYWPATP